MNTGEERTQSAATLHTYVMEGLLPDVFVARQALALLREIAKNGATLRASTFDPFFRAVDVALFEQFILATCRMFDRHSTRFDVRSIPAAIAYIRSNAAEIPVRERRPLERRLRLAGLDRDLGGLRDDALTTVALEFFEAQGPDGDRGKLVLGVALEALKARRDKRVAHSEHAPNFAWPEVRWGEAEALLAYAERFLSCVSFGYLSLALTDDEGHFLVSESDAMRAATALGRLSRSLQGHAEANAT